ncbi:hypothetical protein FRC20_004790 [Serendipita sp. 405]|nr:hypothetical protein FRC15_010947 [Serendipita sp. 397]KAG8802277.1 hypothetical protein FRC16_010019 [Serendipita sp. 398]KAG8867819.1 hypothetical protein FRC20_004790 [Serendipita sp. 405]
MKDVISSLVITLTAVSTVLAHGIARSMHPREIASRQVEANKRHIKARSCAAEINEYHRKRKMAKRDLQKMEKRQFTATTSALEPHETTIRNTTCVTAPEVTEGPYYLNNDLIRQDIREGSGGILLELDIGIIDTSTCQPLPNALVEIWHANATGQYSGFSTTTASTGGGGTGGDSSMSGGAAPSGGAMPSGGGGGDAQGGTGGGVASASMTDSYNFLRGGWPTNDAGIVTFNSVYPGFYTGRTVHIHTMVHTNITYNSNGTYTSRSGTLVHIGQMFFTDELSNQVMALSPYSESTMTRSYNADDSILAQENSAGYSGYVDASLIDESDITKGVLGFITVGVDSTAIHQVSSYNYFAGGDVFVGVDEDSTSVYSSKSTTTAKTSTATGTAAANGSTSGATSRFAALYALRAITSLVGL